MSYLSIIMVITTAMAFLVHATDASTSEFIYRLPCMIVYDGQPPITTSCLANISVSVNKWVEIIRTNNGRSFIIEKTGPGQWHLDHEQAVRVSDEPTTCFQSRYVRVCL